jgi:hypothetical protein
MEPARNQDLIGDWSRQDVSDHFDDAERFELPEAIHHPHEQQRERDKPNSCQNYKPRTKAVNQRSRQYTNRKPGEKESEKETLRYLSSCEGEGLNEVGVKNRETIKNNSNREKKIQEGRENDPPAVINAIRRSAQFAEKHPFPEHHFVSAGGSEA